MDVVLNTNLISSLLRTIIRYSMEMSYFSVVVSFFGLMLKFLVMVAATDLAEIVGGGL